MSYFGFMVWKIPQKQKHIFCDRSCSVTFRSFRMNRSSAVFQHTNVNEGLSRGLQRCTNVRLSWRALQKSLNPALCTHVQNMSIPQSTAQASRVSFSLWAASSYACTKRAIRSFRRQLIMRALIKLVTSAFHLPFEHGGRISAPLNEAADPRHVSAETPENVTRHSVSLQISRKKRSPAPSSVAEHHEDETRTFQASALLVLCLNQGCLNFRQSWKCVKARILWSLLITLHANEWKWIAIGYITKTYLFYSLFYPKKLWISYLKTEIMGWIL